MSECVGCGGPTDGPALDNCRNHGTPQAITIKAGVSADGVMYFEARGDLLKEVWVRESDE